jgi:hypothetical protein
MKANKLILPWFKQKTRGLGRRLHLYANWLGIPCGANDRKIFALKNIHRGKRAFLIGTGPSLRIADLEKLKDEVTFSCNKIYLAFEETEWRPTYYNIADVLVGQNNNDEIRALKLKKLFYFSLKNSFPNARDIVWLRDILPRKGDENYKVVFSKNVLFGTYFGWTTIYYQMQLAYYMGIREIYLLGVDFHYNLSKKKKEIGKGSQVFISDGEINYFHKSYKKEGETWFPPRLNYQRKALNVAKDFFESRGGKIYNASRKTALDVFPLVDFDSLF